MDAIFLSALTPLYVKWLASGLRQFLLAVRFSVLPKILRKKTTIDVYLAFDDPFSYLLVQTLPRIAENYQANINILIINDRQPGMNPEPKLWRQWAINDAQKMALQYGLIAPKSYPDEVNIVTAMQLWQLKRPNLAQAVEFYHTLWQEGFEEHFQHSTPVINHLIRNQQKQASLGHYSSATVFHCGQWYQGVERLDHLERVLLSKKLGVQDEQLPLFSQRELKFVDQSKVETKVESSSPLICYLSIRSPYSYLGLIQARRISEHYGVALDIRPVLPMKMRGLPVPKNKMIYLYLDTLREAKKLAAPFAKFSDPLGQGVIHCYQLFAYAKQQSKDLDYLCAAFKAVYAEGKNLANERVLRELCKSISLDYDKAMAFNQESDWNIWADANLQEMEQFGYWGVPCFQYEETHIWGQDRLWQIEEAIINQTCKA